MTADAFKFPAVGQVPQDAPGMELYLPDPVRTMPADAYSRAQKEKPKLDGEGSSGKFAAPYGVVASLLVGNGWDFAVENT